MACTVSDLYISRKPGGKCRLWEYHMCVSGHVPTFCFLLIFSYFTLSLLKNSTWVPIVQTWFKRTEKLFYYVYNLLKAYLYTELEIIRSVAS